MALSIAALDEKYPNAARFRFGDNRELCTALLALTRSGAKTATCTPYRDIETGKQTMPRVGHHDIALDWDGVPALVIETTTISICRFDEVDEEFALSEGENNDLAGWRTDHQIYFERTGGFSPDMKVVCERFRVIEDLS